MARERIALRELTVGSEALTVGASGTGLRVAEPSALRPPGLRAGRTSTVSGYQRAHALLPTLGRQANLNATMNQKASCRTCSSRPRLRRFSRAYSRLRKTLD